MIKSPVVLYLFFFHKQISVFFFFFLEFFLKPFLVSQKDQTVNTKNSEKNSKKNKNISQKPPKTSEKKQPKKQIQNRPPVISLVSLLFAPRYCKSKSVEAVEPLVQEFTRGDAVGGGR